MSKTFVYMVYFGVYSLAILFIGKSSFGESDSISKFFVGEKNRALPPVFYFCGNLDFSGHNSRVYGKCLSERGGCNFHVGNSVVYRGADAVCNQQPAL